MIDINDLNNKQKEAVTEQIKPILVVAGAGSGKTRVLTMRIGYLIEHFNIKPSRILAITFTNKAANEMRVRIGKILNGTHVSWVGTYHGTCLKILKEEYANVGLCEKFSILDEEDKLLLIKDIYRAGGVDMKILKPNKMIGIISTIKNSAINVNEIRDIKDAKIFSIYSQEELNVVKYVYVLYKEKMLGASLLDFDDLLIFVHKLFKTKPEIAQK
ncbi:hypothetical protein FACS189459_1790 [Bacilli bacterium]|nr:hypothetical protein FACS189459_1790 [Bacilli bacterium]